MASYTQMSQKVPVEEQAIVFDYVNGISVEEYVTAIGQIIGPENIRFVSPISNDFVNIFLNSKETVNKLININTVVNIGTHVLKIRPLIPRSIRIILSNVCPIIPSSIITKELAKLNVQPISQITFIKQNINDPNYAHICGSDREMYIQLEDVSKLPEILQINYNDTNYSILLIMDEITCKEHTNKNSKIEIPTENILNIKDERNNEKDTTNTQIEKIHDATNLKDVPVKNSTWIPQPSTSKATESVICDLTSPFTHNFKKSSEMKKERIKRSKPSIKDISQQLQPAKNFILANMKRYHLNFQNIVELIFNTYGYSNFVVIARSYTKDIPALIDLLLNIKECITNRPLKNQIARIIKGLKYKKTFFL